MSSEQGIGRDAATRAPASDIRALLVTAAALFVVTVVIGILNGLDLIGFQRSALMTHTHAGTLGWITLGVFAAVGWIFGGSRSAREARVWRWSIRLAIVSVPLYVATFWFTSIEARALFAVPVTIAIVGMLAFVGVMSNAMFGLLAMLSRGDDLGAPWAEHLVFWGMNVGLVGFAVGLALEAPILKQAFTPLMGISVLVGLAVYVGRAWRVDVAAALEARIPGGAHRPPSRRLEDRVAFAEPFRPA